MSSVSDIKLIRTDFFFFFKNFIQQEYNIITISKVEIDQKSLQLARKKNIRDYTPEFASLR